MLAAAALWVAAPAMARSRSLSAPLTVTGGVTLSWHGDRARGCAGAGLCDYRGSVAARPGSDGLLELDSDGRTSDVYGFLGFEQRPVIRVERGQDGACVDLADANEFDVFVGPVRSGRVRVGIEAYGLDSGRCAGPDLAPALDRLPTRLVSWNRLRHGGLTIPLRRRLEYSDGRFSGTMISTMRLRVGRFGSDGSVSHNASPPASRGARVRFAELKAAYRVTGLTGSMETTFAAMGAPLCEALDACGLTGRTRWAILSAGGGTVAVTAAAPTRRTDRGVRGAIAAIRRTHAPVSAYGRIRHGLGTTSALLSFPGGRTCSDSRRAAAPGLGFTFESARIGLALGGEEENGLAGDLVRTGCPGPSEADVLGAGSLAGAVLPLTAVRARRLEVPMSGAARFRGPGYSGSRTARFTLGLRRVSLHASYRRGRP